jgi:hypothetical protein
MHDDIGSTSGFHCGPLWIVVLGLWLVGRSNCKGKGESFAAIRTQPYVRLLHCFLIRTMAEGNGISAR